MTGQLLQHKPRIFVAGANSIDLAPCNRRVQVVRPAIAKKKNLAEVHLSHRGMERLNSRAQRDAGHRNQGHVR